MSLKRGRKSPNPADRALGYARLGLKGLAAQRVARKAYKGYKLGKKLPLLLGLGAIAFVVAKRAKGGSAPEPTPPYTPPASGSSPHTGTTPVAPAEPTGASSATEPVAVAETDSAPAADAAPSGDADGAPSADAAPTPDAEEEQSPVENTPKVEEVLENEATTPLTPAAAGTGGAEGEGTPTDEESAEASGESTDAAPPKD